MFANFTFLHSFIKQLSILAFFFLKKNKQNINEINKQTEIVKVIKIKLIQSP